MLEQTAHFEWHTWQHDYNPGRSLQPESGCRPPPVGQHGCTAWHLRLAPVAFHRLPFQPCEASQQVLPDTPIEVQWSTEQVCHYLLRHVVPSRAETASSQHRAGAPQSIRYCRANFARLVGNGRAACDANTMGGKARGNFSTIGVHRKPQQQLGSDGDELDVHEGAGTLPLTSV